MARIGRLLRAAIVVAPAVLFLGCSAAPGPLTSLFPFGSSHDAQLRRQVEADSFPNAKSVGL